MVREKLLLVDPRLQHEYDHLDGILATMRAIDSRSLCLKSQRHLAQMARA